MYASANITQLSPKAGLATGTILQAMIAKWKDIHERMVSSKLEELK